MSNRPRLADILGVLYDSIPYIVFFGCVFMAGFLAGAICERLCG